MEIAENEISRRETHTAAELGLIGAGVALLRYRQLSRHLRHNSVGVAALRGYDGSMDRDALLRGATGLPGGALRPSRAPMALQGHYLRRD